MSVHIIVWQEGDYFIAKCLKNSVASQGETADEARENLKEALALTFEDQSIEALPQIDNVQSETLELA